MKKVFYLSSCDTCAKINKEVGAKEKGFDFQDIKTEKITEAQLDQLKKVVGTYEALFSKVALKYKAWGLKDKNLQEEDFKKYILEEYTFLKRPVFVIDSQVFVGNAPSTVAKVKAAIERL